MARVVLALVDDLIFASRIELEAKNAGARLHRVGKIASMLEAVHGERPALVVVDLDGMGFDGVDALTQLAAEPHADGVPRLAFGSHVEPNRLEAARSAGAEAMARSMFVKELGARIAAALGG